MEFRFEPQWKEELVVHHEGGCFVLEFPMGRPTVCLPSESRWGTIAPLSIRGCWFELQAQLDAWCRDHQFQLAISEYNPAYFD